MHPQLTHTPPGRSRSTTATRIPSWAARIAATYPPGPAPITTRSKCFMESPSPSDGHRLDSADHLVQEPRGLPPVDDAMIEGEAQVDHVARHDLPVPDHGTVHDLVHRQDGRLRDVDDGVAEQPPDGTDAGDRECSAGEVLRGQRPFPGGFRQ